MSARTGAGKGRFAGLNDMAETIDEAAIKRFFGRMRCRFKQAAQGIGKDVTVCGNLGDCRVENGIHVGERGFTMFVGEPGLGVDIRRILEFVELLELGLGIELLEHAAEEENFRSQPGRREIGRILQPDLVGAGHREIGGDGRAFEALRMGDDEFSGRAKICDGIADFFGHARRQAELIGANEDAGDVRVSFGALQCADHVDDRERFGEGKGRARGRVQPLGAKVQLQHSAVARRTRLGARAGRGREEHACDQEGGEHDGKDRTDDNAEYRTKECNPELFHRGAFQSGYTVDRTICARSGPVQRFDKVPGRDR